MSFRPSAITPDAHSHEADLEKRLRPRTLAEFIGQEKIKENLTVFITAALQRGESLEHVLLSGPPGLGKCIAADSLILTDSGYARMADLVPRAMAPGEVLPFEHLVYGIHGPEYTTHVYFSGYGPTLRIRTETGIELEGTPQHPVLAASPEGLVWKRLSALEKGDFVACAHVPELPLPFAAEAVPADRSKCAGALQRQTAGLGALEPPLYAAGEFGHPPGRKEPRRIPFALPLHRLPGWLAGDAASAPVPRGGVQTAFASPEGTGRDDAACRRLSALSPAMGSWDRVEAVTESAAETYDFVVPGTHSFVANGLFNHNTTLGYIIAEEMGANIVTSSGPVLDKPASIAGILTNLNEGDVLFVDEIHRLGPVVEEYLYSAMEDYYIDIVIDSGPNARSVKITLPPFTLVGATTRKGLLTAPLRARFGIDFRYDYYCADLLTRIVGRSARILDIEIDAAGAVEIARRSRGTPRIANRLLRRARDFAEVKGPGRITRAVADHALTALEVDEEGLDDMDARILTTLIEKFGGGPAGLTNVAVSVGEDAGTIEEVYEPYLIQEGYLMRTPRGRVATPRAYRHFGIAAPPRTPDLFEGGTS